jgi:hypothetical protein
LMFQQLPPTRRSPSRTLLPGRGLKLEVLVGQVLIVDLRGKRVDLGLPGRSMRWSQRRPRVGACVPATYRESRHPRGSA